MPQLLTLSRAAQLMGTTRAILQKHIAAGELASFDGMVAADQLRRLFPDLQLENAGAFESFDTVKERIFHKRLRESQLPNQEILAQRLARQGEELDDARRHLALYHDLLEALRERIEQALPAAELGRFLDAGLARILGSDEAADPVAVMDDILRVMSAQVTVKPSGHVFFVEGNETILEAALRSGMAPAYGCGNGNCGLCKARLVSGTVRQVRKTDYPLSQGERAQGHTLLCSHTAVSDLVIEMLEAGAPDDIPAQDIIARVKAIEPLADDLWQLHLQTPRTRRLRFLAGQRVTLGVTGGGLPARGDYPLASCPCDDRNLIFHIRRPAAERDDFATRLFAGAIRLDDPVSVFGPFGQFVLDKTSPRDLVFLVCDSGFAPVRSLIEHAFAADLPGFQRLIWVATEPAGHYLENQCRAWADAIETFSYLALTAPDPLAGATRIVARLREECEFASRDIYLVGPESFVDTARQALLDAGLPTARLRAEVL